MSDGRNRSKRCGVCIDGMKRLICLLAIVCSLAGCEQKDRDVIATESSKAWEHASKAAMAAWVSVSKKVSEISPNSSEEAMQAAVQLQEELERGLQSPSRSREWLEQRVQEARQLQLSLRRVAGSRERPMLQPLFTLIHSIRASLAAVVNRPATIGSLGGSEFSYGLSGVTQLVSQAARAGLAGGVERLRATTLPQKVAAVACLTLGGLVAFARHNR